MSDHLTTITGPTANGYWVWSCTTDGCDAALNDGEVVEFRDIGDAMTFAGGHGNLDPDCPIVQLIDQAVALNGPQRAIDYYDDELLPIWRAKFPPWKVAELEEIRQQFVDKRDALVAQFTATV